jgi:hypothetical protein
MAQESQLAHRNIRSTNLPYQTNVSPTQTDPYYAFGSHDILTSITGYAERRPGFSGTVEPNQQFYPGVFPGPLAPFQRFFTWDRTDGTFIIMASILNSTTSAWVYKLQVGLDQSFQPIYTGDISGTPFDFVVSNNTCYFSNGTEAKKWDPVNGLSNWGIAMSTVNNNATSVVTSFADVANSFTNSWNTGTLTCSFTAPAHTTSGTHYLSLTGTTFGLSAASVITGVAVSVTGTQTNGNAKIVLTYHGTPLGSVKNLPITGAPVVLGGSNDMWGAGLTGSIISDSTFGVFIYEQISNGTGASFPVTAHITNVTITVYYQGGPAVSLVSGGFNPAPSTGYQYVFCYYNANTGHVSSPTPVSNLIKPDSSHSVQISLTASTDPQVTNIKLFRTTDGGGGIYYELPTSPYPNTTANVVDSAPDTQLQISSIAPTATFNDPPTPGRNCVYFSGRIWMWNGNKVYFSGLEEIVQGVPEESFPSGVAGNYWAFDEPVTSLGVAGSGTSQTLVIFCGGRMYGIVGNTLDTFQRYIISNRRGTRCNVVASLGGMVAWFDTSNQVWATDGSSLNELSTDIRPDLIGFNPANITMTFHVSGRFHWLVMNNGNQGSGNNLYIYDMDLNQWMPPWSVQSSVVYSGETSPGNYQLMSGWWVPGNQSAAVTMTTNVFTDFTNAGQITYQPVIKTGLMAVVPDYGRRFSYMAMGIYDEPSRTGFPYTIQVTNNAQTITMAYGTDEDPRHMTYVSAGNPVDTATTYNRVNGTFLTQKVWTLNGPASRWVSLLITLANANQIDNLYEIFLAYKPMGGR